jgi:hypothetical protein
MAWPAPEWLGEPFPRGAAAAAGECVINLVPNISI